MLENEFEKRVQQKMDEFRLRPSGDVWGNVEKELRRKKKRRVVFYIFFLAGLSLLGYTGIFLLNQTQQNLVEQNSTPPANESSIATEQRNDKSIDAGPSTRQEAGRRSNNNKDSFEHTDIPTGNDQPAGQASTGEKVEQEDPVISKKGGETKTPTVRLRNQRPAVKEAREKIAANDINDNPDETAKPGITKKAKIKEDSRDPLQKPEEEIRKNITDIANSKIENRVPEAQTEKKDLAEASVNKESAKQPTSGDSTKKADELQPKNETAKVESSAKTKSKKGLQLNWGLEFSAGVTDVNKSAFSFPGSQRNMDAFSSPLPITPNYSLAARPTVGPSEIEPGLGFSIGPSATLQFTKRSSVMLGLQYAYHSTNMRIGTYMQTSITVNNAASQNKHIEALYQGYPSENYTNRYHFIRVPLNYQLQLNKGKKLPILWTAGVSAGYLISTNGLLYDTALGGIYYYDDKAFNRLQLNVQSGFAFRFGNRQRIQWSLGPELSFATNKLMDDAVGRKHYLFYGGITGRLFLSKKK